MDATTAVESSGNDRSIESDRLSRALTESLTVRDAGKLQYLVGHEDAEYLVDVEAGTCECPDYRHLELAEVIILGGRDDPDEDLPALHRIGGPDRMSDLV
jgi:hypothetical protein